MEAELSKIEKKISEKEIQIREVLEEIKKERVKPREEIIEKLKGIKRTTGQHPGGLLITLPDTDIHKYTPLNYPANNRKAE
jgi:DNA polymerase-3 subunit alpha (Gram-positive type)